MAGIGFQLKRLFDREGLIGRIQAISYASLVTVGPMLSSMLAVAIIHWLLINENAPFQPRELFQAGTSYAFAFSLIVTGPFSMILTRIVSDQLYQKRYDDMLPTFYGCLRLAMICAVVPALLFILFTPLLLAEKVALLILYMELVLIWIGVVYVSAMKAYRRISVAFASGMGIAILAVWLLIRFAGNSVTAVGMFAGLALGFFVTAALLLWAIVKFFQTHTPGPTSGFLKDVRKYPSLLAVGLFTSLSMFEHQFAQWIFNGEWMADSFLMTPEYDVAVYYAVLSVLPTLIWFVVSVETTFYPKFREYYDLILGKGTILDIDRARGEMEKVLIGELTRMMGIQLVFSLVAVACGIRFLPYIGFMAQQVDTFNILVMSFYVYIMTSMALLLLLYFDDRKGALVMSATLFVSNVIFSWILQDEQFQGLSLFVASFPVLAITLGRLFFRLRRLHYATFSAQPLFARKHDSSQSEAR